MSKVIRKMSRLEMYKAAIEFLEFEKGAKKGDVSASGKFAGGFDGCVKHMQDSKGIPAENAKKLCAFIGRNAGKIKFDLSKREIACDVLKLRKLLLLQTVGQDQTDLIHLADQIKENLDRMAYFPTDPREIGNYNGNVQDIRDGMEGKENKPLSLLAQKLKQ